MNSFCAVLVSFGLVLALGTAMSFAYSGSDLPDLSDGLGGDLDEDPAQAFQSSLVNSIAVLSTFMQQTQQGKNVSDFSLGMFVSKILGTLGSVDKTISSHLHANDRFTEGYLVEVFQNHPDAEIAFFNQLSTVAGNPHQAKLDLTAADALECLKHIPDGKEGSEIQAKDRADLSHAFGALKSQLTGLAQEAAAK